VVVPIWAGCARAASGHAAVPPSSVMNSRELVLFYDAKLATRGASPTGLLALHGHLNERGQIVGCRPPRFRLQKKSAQSCSLRATN
jgi:hypothetical protein